MIEEKTRTLVRCEKCKVLQTLNLWESRYYDKKPNCCNNCGHNKYKITNN